MALNFSHRPIFPVNQSEDNLVSSMIANGDGYGMPLCFNWEMEIEDSRGYGRDRIDRESSCDPIANDILDLLPSDPFGMNMSAAFTEITGWFGDFGTDELNFIWNQAMKFQAEPGNVGMGISDRENPSGKFDGWVDGEDLGFRSCDGICKVEEFLRFCDKYTSVASPQTEELVERTELGSNGNEGGPHEALLYTLGYLGVQDLLSVERVCRLLRSTVQGDPLLWKSIHIDQPLSERINDDALFRLTSRAQGNLQYLSLVECSKVTDDGLKRVLESNPRLTKLSVPGCTRLSVEGIVNHLKAFKSSGAPGIKQLRIGGRYGVTNEHFEELKSLLGADKCMSPRAHKPRFYHNGYWSLFCDDDRSIDIEMCPRCQNLRLVYDCPAESCQGKQIATQPCRACTICIARCAQCGRCINDSEYEETFCLDLLCSDCLKPTFQCLEKHDEKGSSSEHTVSHEETRCDHHLHG